MPVDRIGVFEARMLLGMLVSMRAQLATSLPKRMCSSQISTFTEKLTHTRNETETES